MLTVDQKAKIILKAINLGHPIGALFLPKLHPHDLYEYARKIGDKKLVDIAADITINMIKQGKL